MRYRRRTNRKLSPKQQLYLKWADEAEVHCAVLSIGIGEAIKRATDEKALKVLVDLVEMKLIPMMREREKWFDRAYPDRLRARTRKNPKPRKTAPKSANGKKKAV